VWVFWSTTCGKRALIVSAWDRAFREIMPCFAMIVVGIGVGILGALAAGRLLQHLVDGMRPTDLSTLAIMIPILLAAALFASLIPARRASQVDPISALRQE
jgi:ABC-type antimicrobial peptide transport system permease subunit